MSLEPWMHCSDLAASLAFYTEILDFETLVAPHPDPEHFMSRYAMLKRGESRLHLSAHGADPSKFGTLVYVRVTNIDALYERFAARGMVVTMPGPDLPVPIDQTWGMREFGCQDPDGNLLTFGQEIDRQG